MKQNSFRHLVALILMMCCTLGGAQIFEIDGFTYNVIDESKRYVEVSKVEDKENTKTVKIPSTVTRGGVTYTVTSIGEKAFEWCSSLTSINIPSSVKSIEIAAFHYCESLTSINIPSSVKSIESGAFTYCSSLTQIQVSPDNPVYDSRDNCNAIIETKSNTLIAGCASTVIPNSVTSIGDGVFIGCSSLTSINIPNSVKSIGDVAFGGCSGLTSINIPSSVSSIGESAFQNCSSLTSINIPSSVKSIGKEVFKDCESLTTITLPEHITNIDDLEIPEGVRIIKKEEEEVFSNASVEIGADYPGGEAAILRHIAKNIKYPKIAIEHKIQGVVILRFKIGKDGSVSDVSVVRSLSPECDREAIRVVKTLGRFTPAKKQGKIVAVWYMLPVRFQID